MNAVRISLSVSMALLAVSAQLASAESQGGQASSHVADGRHIAIGGQFGIIPPLSEGWYVFAPRLAPNRYLSVEPGIGRSDHGGLRLSMLARVRYPWKGFAVSLAGGVTRGDLWEETGFWGGSDDLAWTDAWFADTELAIHAPVFRSQVQLSVGLRSMFTFGTCTHSWGSAGDEPSGGVGACDENASPRPYVGLSWHMPFAF